MTDTIAINVALLPDEQMRRRAEAVNRRLLQDYSQGFALDEQRVPHVTLAQAFVNRGDLDAIWDQVAALDLGHELRAEAFDFFPKGGFGTAGFDVSRPPWLLNLHRQVAEVLAPFALSDGDESAFLTTRDEAGISPSSINYVRTFFQAHSGGHYNPHLTLGRAHREFLESVRKEPFADFDFAVEALGIYQLGNHGTCRKQLRQMRL